MFAKGHRLLAAVALATLSAPAAPAQPPPPAPVPIAPPATPAPPPTLGPPGATPFPGPPAPPPPPAPLFAPPAPGRNGWAEGPSCDTGLVYGVELDFTKPHLKNRVGGTVTFPDGSTDTILPPQTDLAWTVAPTFLLGYRLGDEYGEFDFAYRFLTSEGNAIGATTLGDLTFRSRLDLNQFDLDYASARYSPGPFWDLKWRVGARLATVFFDSREALDGFADESASNTFVGAGPHFGLDAERRFGLLPGLAAFGRADGAVLIGQINQKFREDFTLADGSEFPGVGEQRGSQSVPVLNLQAGLSYTPPRMDFLHFTAGYQFDQWWSIGRLNGNNAALTDQGVFLRGEFDY